jgi:hypothetical protein
MSAPLRTVIRGLLTEVADQAAALGIWLELAPDSLTLRELAGLLDDVEVTVIRLKALRMSLPMVTDPQATVLRAAPREPAESRPANPVAADAAGLWSLAQGRSRQGDRNK